MTPSLGVASLDALHAQFVGDPVQVVGVRVAVAGAVAVQLGLVVDAVPGDAVLVAGGVRGADGEDEPPPPRLLQQPQHLTTPAAAVSQ